MDEELLLLRLCEWRGEETLVIFAPWPLDTGSKAKPRSSRAEMTVDLEW